MTGLPIRPADECAYDLVCLGEIMLRLDPGEKRVRNARTFGVWGAAASTTSREACVDALGCARQS